MRNPPSAIRNLQCAAGFTLSELMVTVIIIGILSSIAVPSYVRTVERGRWRAVRDVLETIYAGETVYGTVNNSNYYSVSGGGDWGPIYMDDPNAPKGPFPTSVALSATGGAGTFSGTATQSGGGCGAWALTINQTHTWSGTTTEAGICP